MGQQLCRDKIRKPTARLAFLGIAAGPLPVKDKGQNLLLKQGFNVQPLMGHDFS